MPTKEKKKRKKVKKLRSRVITITRGNDGDKLSALKAKLKGEKRGAYTSRSRIEAMGSLLEHYSSELGVLVED